MRARSRAECAPDDRIPGPGLGPCVSRFRDDPPGHSNRQPRPGSPAHSRSLRRPMAALSRPGTRRCSTRSRPMESPWIRCSRHTPRAVRSSVAATRRGQSALPYQPHAVCRPLFRTSHTPRAVRSSVAATRRVPSALPYQPHAEGSPLFRCSHTPCAVRSSVPATRRVPSALPYQPHAVCRPLFRTSHMPRAVRSSVAGTRHYHRSLIVVVPELTSPVEHDLRLPLGKFVSG